MNDASDKLNSGGGGAALAPENSHKVLVVDDEHDIVEVLSYLLSRAGYEIATAQTGMQAIEAVREGGVGLVLLDYMLPDINGLEVLKEIKAFSAGIKVVIVTGRASDKVLADVLEAGASSYVIKPFVNDQLLRVVRETLAGVSS